MLRRFLGRTTQRFSLQTLKLPIVRVGRMSAETSIDLVKEKLIAELQQVGWKQLFEIINAEELVLMKLMAERKEFLKVVEHKALKPAISRFNKGYSVGGLFWQQSQEHLKEKISKEKYLEIEEKIDWLTTRKNLFKNPSVLLKSNEDSPSTSSSCIIC